MIWQDVIMATVALVFPISLIDSINRRQYPSRVTSITTGTALTLLAAVAFTIPFYFVPTINLITAAIWFFLAYKRTQE